MTPELAIREGWPQPGSLPRGDCILTSLYDEQGSVTGLHIDHADPRVLISLELLDAIVRSGDGSWVTIRVRDENYCGPGCWDGAVITIRATNRTVIYRLIEYVPAVNGYIAEWPD